MAKCVMKKNVITVDGPSASGKGTLARRLAQHYDLPYLDTGSLYRRLACALIDRRSDISDPSSVSCLIHNLSRFDFPDTMLRSDSVGEVASTIAAMAHVRSGLFSLQRAFADQSGGAVLDGRDTGTAIYPEAPAKFFLTASPEVRALRRFKEFEGRTERLDLSRVLSDIIRRDERDVQRAASPLRAAPDAKIIDATLLSQDEVFALAIEYAQYRLNFKR